MSGATIVIRDVDDLIVRQLPDPPPALGGRDTLEALAALYLALPGSPSAGEQE